MTIAVTQPIPLLQLLPKSLPMENAVRLELAEGVPMMRATSMVQERIESLLIKQEGSLLSDDENEELDLYQEVDDYLSFVNRIVRNLLYHQQVQTA